MYPLSLILYYGRNLVKSYEILKTYLKNDYNIIDQMYKYGWISDKQYKILKS